MKECTWCDREATHEVVISPGRHGTVGGIKCWIAENTAPACDEHAARNREMDREVREV